MRQHFNSQVYSRTAWLSLLMGSTFAATIAGVSASWADVPAATAVQQSQTVDGQLAAALPTRAVQAAGQAPIITNGPVYAYGPVIQTAKPRQRSRQSNGNSGSGAPYYGPRTAKPYGTYRTQAYRRPQAPYGAQPWGQSGGQPGGQPWQSAQSTDGYWRWQPRRNPQSGEPRRANRSLNTEGFASYNRGGPQAKAAVTAPPNGQDYYHADQTRQPNWRY
jgi:hypothetical protein